ncbi:MAG: hypothetical protein LBL23_01270 [Coriobacteriales bacterium]|jgi:hypothetical protein|nr:hypothetical protein [Coriobacteriales bacterium]
MKHTTLTMNTKKTRITLRVLLAAVLALSGLLLATPAGADETEGRVTADEGVFTSPESSERGITPEIEPSDTAPFPNGLESRD